MRILRGWLPVSAAAFALACSGDSSSPTGGGGGGGPVGSVVVGNIFFESAHNGTSNPAVDTVASGATVTWTWTGTGGTEHSVQSLGTPSFQSSAPVAGNGNAYTMTFNTPGTYQYNCAIHGNQMTGRIVVQ
jgi:plastocyanin